MEDANNLKLRGGCGLCHGEQQGCCGQRECSCAAENRGSLPCGEYWAGRCASWFSLWCYFYPVTRVISPRRLRHGPRWVKPNPRKHHVIYTMPSIVNGNLS